jgi:glycosyltransferase involved in cell wall biosynthesis
MAFPSVSVVIATYNRPDYLRAAIKSVVDQTYVVEQIVVVDDCSSADLKSIVDEFSESNILYFRKKENKGVSNSRNIGIQKATGDWIAFLDDDDLFLASKIQQNIDDALRVDNCVAVLCSYSILETGAKRKSPASGRVQDSDLKQGNLFCGATGLFAKRECLLNELFDESLPMGEDWDIFVRLQVYGVVYFNSSSLFLYRNGGHESITSQARKLTILQMKPRIRSAYKHREWLGEIYFKRRIAYQILSYISVKDHKLAWLKESIKLAGFTATFFVLYTKLFSKSMSD